MIYGASPQRSFPNSSFVADTITDSVLIGLVLFVDLGLIAITMASNGTLAEEQDLEK